MSCVSNFHKDSTYCDYDCFVAPLSDMISNKNRRIIQLEMALDEIEHVAIDHNFEFDHEWLISLIKSVKK